MEPDSKYSAENKRRDFTDGWNRARRYHAELKDIHRYFSPFRSPTTERSPEGGDAPEGGERAHYLYDGTAPSAQANFVANMKADWLPSFEPFFTLDNGPLTKLQLDEGARKKRLQDLQTVADVANALLVPMRQTSDELFHDLFAGTAAMYLKRGSRRNPIQHVVAPVTEIALDTGPDGNVIQRVWWRRNFKGRHIAQHWPDAEIPKGLASRIKGDRNCDVDVIQYTYWDPRDEIWRLCVWTDQDADAEIWSEAFSANPWVTPRIFVVPGEAMGRGWAHLGLPFVRTVNKARELALRAAAFALLGLWTRRSDGVFNPKTAVMAPGAMWKVATNGGPLGATIQRLDVPHNFDISTVVINDEREQIRRVLLDDELPELSDRVRSPTEIAGRMRRYDRNRGGATTRLAQELVRPIVERTLDLMIQIGILPGNVKLTIDQILTEVTITSPAAAMQKTGKNDRLVAWLEMIVMLLGPDALKLHTAIEDIIPEIGRNLGVDERHIRSVTQVEMLQDMISNAVAKALAQQKAAKDAPAPAPPQPRPEAAYLNGGV